MNFIVCRIGYDESYPCQLSGDHEISYQTVAAGIEKVKRSALSLDIIICRLTCSIEPGEIHKIDRTYHSFAEEWGSMKVSDRICHAKRALESNRIEAST